MWKAGHIPRLKKVPWTLLHLSIELRRAAGLIPVFVVAGEVAAEAVAPFFLYVLFAEISKSSNLQIVLSPLQGLNETTQHRACALC